MSRGVLLEEPLGERVTAQRRADPCTAGGLEVAVVTPVRAEVRERLDVTGLGGDEEHRLGVVGPGPRTTVAWPPARAV